LERLARIERVEAMSGESLQLIIGSELRWMANDVMMMSGLGKAGLASKQLLANLAMLGGMTDDHQLYAAVLRIAVHTDVCVDLLKGLCLALIAAGTILYTPPSEGNDFVPVISALNESAGQICRKLEADGEINSRDDVQKLVTLTSTKRYQYLDQPADKTGAESLGDGDSLFVWETLVQIAYFMGSVEAISVGAKYYYRVADSNPSLPREVRQSLSTGHGLADAIVALSLNITESPVETFEKSGKTLLGDAAWRTNGINRSGLVQCRNDAMSTLQRLSAEYSLLDKEIDKRSKPNQRTGADYSVVQQSTLTSFNRALETAHSELSKVVGYTKKVGLKIPRITSTAFGWGLLSQGLSFELLDSGNAVKTFVGMPCHWRGRADKVGRRVEAVLAKENAISELQVAASQSSSLIEKSHDELAAAMNRCAELDSLLNVYIEKNKVLEASAKSVLSSSSQVEQLEKDNKVMMLCICITFALYVYNIQYLSRCSVPALSH
jgi:hypothetical protein